MSTHDASRIQAQEIRSILNHQVVHELIHATCRENAYVRQKVMDLDEAITIRKGATKFTDLKHSRKAAADLQTSINNMHI
jgi:hypothetical protein